MAGSMEKDNLIELTAEIVSAYVSSNNIASSDLTSLIREIHAALHRTASGKVEPAAEPLKPAVPARKSVMPDYIICLEDGQKFKSLKRHLRTHYDLTPEAVPREMGPSRRLSDGRAELRQSALDARQEDGAWPEALGRRLASALRGSRRAAPSQHDGLGGARCAG